MLRFTLLCHVAHHGAIFLNQPSWFIMEACSSCFVMCRTRGRSTLNSPKDICTSTKEQSHSQSPSTCWSYSFRPTRGLDHSPWCYKLASVASLTAWLEASSNSTPPLRITESMVAVEQLPSILPRQYSVLHYLHRRGVFQDDGWSQLLQAHIALAESPGVSVE